MDFAKGRREVLKDWVTIVVEAITAIAIVLGGGWAFFVFVWEESRIRHEEPVLRAKIVLETAPPCQVDDAHVDAGGPVPIYMRVTLENVSKRTMKVLAGQLTLHADRVPDAPPRDLTPEAVAKSVGTDRVAIRRYWPKQEAELVFSGGVFVGWRSAPGGVSEMVRLAWVPRGVFQQVEANLYIKAVRYEDDDPRCLAASANDELSIDVEPGLLKDGTCVPFSPGSRDAWTLDAENSRTLEATDFLGLAP